MGHPALSKVVALSAAAALALAGCGRGQHRQPPTGSSAITTPATDFAATLRKHLTGDAMMAHLSKLQEIADTHGGVRALGTSGYDASVDYVASTLQDKGFDVQTPEFEVHLPFADDPVLTVGGDKFAAKPLEFTNGTSPGGVSGPMVPAPVDDTPGCTASDYKGIALYLNFDMLGSPNPGYFTYDGDQSAAPDPNHGVPWVPEGSAGIERTLAAYLKGAGKTPQDTSFDGRSDYDGFTKAGVPAGGLFSGAEDNKSDEQAKLWGGQAGEPFDPNYHTATDTLDHVDNGALEIHGGGVAYTIGLYARDQTGRNGVPIRDDRTRHVLDS